MEQAPKSRIVFLSRLIGGYLDADEERTLVVNDLTIATLIREKLANMLNDFDDPQVLVLDLAGVAFTPSFLQEMILPLAQRIRGGEHGRVHLVACTTDPAVGDYIRYMAQAYQLPVYLSRSPLHLEEGIPVGNITGTQRDTLDTIIMLGGQVTASSLANAEDIGPSAATNRLVNLNREGYLIRQPRGRRKGDVYIEPRSATSVPIRYEELYEANKGGTGSGVKP